MVETDVAASLRTERAVRGPVPPKVGQVTAYELVWELRNSTSDVQEARMETTLPRYVQWEANTSANSGIISYNQDTRQLVWDIGSITAGAGYPGGAISPRASMQVSLQPSLSQVGSSPALTEKISFEGVDVFTGTDLRFVADENETTLSSGVGSVASSGNVVE